jgi:HlyD family secretion protein
VDLYITEAKNNLNQIFELLNNLALAVNTTQPNGISQATLDNYKTYVSTARTNLNTAITALTTAEEKLKTSQSALALAENELALKKAGAVPEQIAAQEARVKAGWANVQNYQTQIAKTILRSPIKGVVTRQDAKVGQIAAAQTIIASIISAAEFQVETNIPEADIAKIKIGDKAEITLDAYGDDVIFQAEVVAIDPAGKIIEGVAAYKVTLQFLTEDSRLKPEMTANIDILTARLENVIAVPRRAVITENGQKFIEIVTEKGDIKKVEVKTGIIGSDGNIEIKNGLKEGDKVIIFRK